MTPIRPLKIFTAVLALAFIAKATAATAQVIIPYGNPANSNPDYRGQGYTTRSYSPYNGYSYTPSPGIHYQQLQPQFGTQSGQYRSGFRGNYAAPYQSYRPSDTTPFQTYGPSQDPVYYGNQINGNSYYNNGYNGYNGTQSQQRGASIGGTIGNAIGGQRSGNIGAAIGAAVGRQ